MDIYQNLNFFGLAFSRSPVKPNAIRANAAPDLLSGRTRAPFAYAA